jgi:Pvc16 N-terminal domain
LTIGAVTAVLRDVLANGLIHYSTTTRIGDVNITVLSPERIAVGADEPNQINLFLYRVAPHSRLPQTVLRDHWAAAPVGEPSRRTLPLDLHYLVTAYGAHDFHSEILLGCAVHLLNGTPVLTAESINDLLKRPVNGPKNGSTSPAREALAKVQMPLGAKQLDIRQEFLSFEDMSKLWSVLQARYRPSVAYRVSAIDMALDAES